MKRRALLAALAGAPLAAAASMSAAAAESVDKHKVRVLDDVLADDGSRELWRPAFTAGEWDLCASDSLLMDDFGSRCWIGIDLASKREMASVATIFEQPNDKLALFADFYAPIEWVRSGGLDAVGPIDDDLEHKSRLTITAGTGADFDEIGFYLRHDMCSAFDVRAVVCDQYQSAATSQQLIDIGVPVVDFDHNRNTTAASATDLLERVATGRLVHDGNPLLREHALKARNWQDHRFMPYLTGGRGPSVIHAAVMANAVRLESKARTS